MTTHASRIATELNIHVRQVEAVATLLEQDATVPFIARYRKEVTGSLDEVAITAVRDRLAALVELDKRRTAMLESLTERDLLTPEIEAALHQAQTMTELEDRYLPWRPKRKTRASTAREKGLEPLAVWLFEQHDGDPLTHAADFINDELGVASAEDALAGARDILAEQFAEDPAARERMRGIFSREAHLASHVVKGKEEEGAKFRDYFEFSELSSKAPSHRILALFRGEEEGILRLKVRPSDEEAAMAAHCHAYVKSIPSSEESSSGQVYEAARDSYSRLLGPSMENDLRAALKSRADAEAIRIFAENLRQLLLAAPMGPKPILAVDPGFRTGCKVVSLSREGALLEYVTINPHAGSAAEKENAGREMLRLAEKYSPDAVAVGNGTAGRESEAFIRALPGWNIPVVMVSESGASVYSASEAARAEFPDLDLTYRGAVSIGRRLMDPLAELVKIDPKAIGVGQYQHDVNQADLKRSLDDVVMSCVNGVGVELNTASEALLSYVSGLGPTLAKNIVEYRHANGTFASRKELLKVTRLGPKAFEQAAGFLRIREGKEPLDRTAIHPERYALVGQMAKDAKVATSDLMTDASVRAGIDLSRYVSDSVGLPTLRDIMAELEKPGRDPRGDFSLFSFAENIHGIDDLVPGMRLPGIVTNITAFGAFVDIGVHQDGLVHVSQMANRFVRDPAEVVHVHQQVVVTVLEVDTARKRIALSLKDEGAEQEKAPPRRERTQHAAKAPKPARPEPRGTQDRTKPEAFGNNPFAGLGKKLR